MMKKLFLVVVTTALSLTLFGQSAVVTSGGTANGTGGTVTYTIGQIADQKVAGGGQYIIEGVQQPFEIQTVGINNYPGITLSAVVYPNPTVDKVMLSIRNFEIPSYGLTVQLFDFNGRLVKTFTVNDLDTEIDFSQYAATTYQLRIVDQKTLLKTFKVVKNSL